jgi:hypothetical protein
MKFKRISSITAAESLLSPGRRAFFGKAATVAAGLAGSAALTTATGLAKAQGYASLGTASGKVRQVTAWQIRTEAARLERNRPLADHSTNGDETRYSNKIANYTKGLPHNSLGEVDPAAWNSLIQALGTGDPADFEQILMGGSAKLVNPQAGLAFAMQGSDSHATGMKAAPAFSSAEQAADAGENYWMALTRDVPFADYLDHSLTQQAASDLDQIGFSTLGDPYIASVLCAVAREALKSVWFQKWFVHRRLRPEVFGGRIHNHMNGAARYPIHSDILNSAALDAVYHRNGGSYLLPQGFPEGSPLHPSYGAGHATVAGACVTILKAFFDEHFVITNPLRRAPMD